MPRQPGTLYKALVVGGFFSVLLGAVYCGYRILEGEQPKAQEPSESQHTHNKKTKKKKKSRKEKNARPEFDQNLQRPALVEEIDEDTNAEQQTFITRGRQYFHNKAFESALACYLQALVDEPTNTRLNLDVARCYYQLGNLDMCVQYAGIALVLDKSTYEALYLQGMAFAAGKRYQEAKAVFQEMTTFPSDNSVYEGRRKLVLVERLLAQEAAEKAEQEKRDALAEESVEEAVALQHHWVKTSAVHQELQSLRLAEREQVAAKEEERELSEQEMENICRDTQIKYREALRGEIRYPSN